MYTQIFPYFDAVFSKFTKVQKWRKTLDEGGETGTNLTDLSKAFDCTDHNLVIAKLNTYGLEKRSLEFIHFYLTKRKQRTKLTLPLVHGKCYSQVCHKMLFSGVPQG